MALISLIVLVIGFISGGIWGAIGAVVLFWVVLFIFGAILSELPENTLEITILSIIGVVGAIFLFKLLKSGWENIRAFLFIIIFFVIIGGLNYLLRYEKIEKNKKDRNK